MTSLILGGRADQNPNKNNDKIYCVMRNRIRVIVINNLSSL